MNRVPTTKYAQGNAYKLSITHVNMQMTSII